MSGRRLIVIKMGAHVSAHGRNLLIVAAS